MLHWSWLARLFDYAPLRSPCAVKMVCTSMFTYHRETNQVDIHRYVHAFAGMYITDVYPFKFIIPASKRYRCYEGKRAWRMKFVLPACSSYRDTISNPVFAFFKRKCQKELCHAVFSKTCCALVAGKYFFGKWVLQFHILSQHTGWRRLSVEKATPSSDGFLQEKYRK